MSCFFQVSLGLISAKASHIVWPPSRWQRLDRFLPSQRVKHPAANFPLQNWTMIFPKIHDFKHFKYYQPYGINLAILTFI